MEENDQLFKLSKREVVTGLRQRGEIEIVSGLSEGELIVTDGIVKASEGALVKSSQEVS
jgi:membrane fusion protein, multidrug efflux system